MRKLNVLAAIALTVILCSTIAVAPVFANGTDTMTVNDADGVFSNPSGDGGPPTCIWQDNSMGDITNENLVLYGDDDPSEIYGPCPYGDITKQSGFGYDGIESLTIEACTPFIIGTLTHYNRDIYIHGGNNFKQVDLDIALNVAEIGSTIDLNFVVALDETPNSAPCQYPGSTVCPDKITLSGDVGPSEIFIVDNVPYKLDILGFSLSNTVAPTEATTEVITEEDQNTPIYLWAHLKCGNDEEPPCPPIPEASTIALMSVGILALGGYIFLRKRNSTQATTS